MSLPFPSSNNATTTLGDLNDSKQTSIWVLDLEFMFYFRAVILSVVCLGFNILGVVTNVINMVVFWRLGFKDSINISLYALAISDFGACLSVIWMLIAMNPWFRQLDLWFEPDEVSYLTSAWPHVAFTKVTTLITAFITFERCLCVKLPLKVKTYITPGRAKASLIFSYLLIAVMVAPIFYCTRFGWKFYPELNKSMIGVVFIEERAVMETVSLSVLNVILSPLSFLFVTACTIVLVASLRQKSKWRQSTSNSAANDVSAKERKVVKMVVLISALFISCFIPTAVMQMIMMAERDVSVDGKYSRLNKTLAGISFTLESVNSSMNIFIYYHNSSNYKSVYDLMFRVQKRQQGKQQHLSAQQ